MADEALEALLEVQGLDLAADRLRHRRTALPERAQVAERRRALVQLDAGTVAVQERSALLQRSAKRLEDEVASVEARATDADRKLYSGSVTAVRELQSLQDDVESLRRRARSLEDDLLEIMEQAEPVTAELESAAAERSAIEAEVSAVQGRLAEADGVLAEELAAAEAARAVSAQRVPSDLLATYESMRPKLDGIAIARLEGGRCGGCHLGLPATELDAIRHALPGAIVRHEECGRILVH